MKTRLVMIVVFLSMALSLAPLRSSAQGGAPPAAAAQGRKGKGERHPHIRHAIQALQNAKRQLQQAAHDYGGHRSKAVEHVDQALGELQQALQFDQK